MVYGSAIIVIYLILGLLITGIFGASALNNLATGALFNLIFFALLVFFVHRLFLAALSWCCHQNGQTGWMKKQIRHQVL